MSTKYMTDSQSESQNAKKKKIREFEDYVNSEQFHHFTNAGNLNGNRLPSFL